MLKRLQLKNILWTIMLLLLSGAGMLSCSKQLSASGASNFGAMSLYLQPDSDIKVFSYLNGYPEFVTSLTPNGESISVPRTILVPKLNFGVPENPLLYVSRTNPSVATPIDLIIKVYSPSSPSPDYYFEIPVLGTPLTPTNTTTALSWILRYSFAKQVVSLSYNQFLSLVTKIEVACSDCRAKSNTEVVGVILSDANLTNSIIDEVKKSNTSMTISGLNYQPPALDYAWSSPTISSNWKILTSVDEPTNLDDSVNINVDSILVDPLNSPNKIRPGSWAHVARLDDASSINSSSDVTLPTISGTPLNYDFDRFSSGRHTFTSQYTGVASTPLAVIASVIDKNRTPLCISEASIPVKANHILSIKLDRTILPATLDSVDVAMTRVTTSKVAVSSITNLPVSNSAKRYDIIFDTATAAPAILYRVERTDMSGTTTTLQSAQTYLPGKSIVISEADNRFTLIANGTPINGDKIRFYLPVTPASSNDFIDRIGCIDPDPSIESALTYELVSGPAGLTLSANGRVTWISDISFYNANPSHTTSMTANVTDSLGLTRQLNATIILTEDQFPRLCLTKDVNGVCSEVAPTRLPALPTTGYSELTSVNQLIYTSDADGDPIKMTIVALGATSGTLSLVSNASTAFTSMTLITSSTAAASTTSIFDYRWNFNPHMNQIVNDASGTVRAEIRLAYDTVADPTLSPSNLATFPIEIVVNNTMDVPLRVASSIANCGAVSCTAATNVQANYTPQVFALNFSAASASAVLLDPANGSPNTTIGGGVAVSNIFYEGASATAVLPVIAVRRNSIASASAMMYEIGQQTSTCPFIKNGRVKLEEAKCSPAATGNDCLVVYMNYDSRNGTQEVLPRFSPQRCTFNLYARDPAIPDNQTLLGNYIIYVQDIVEAPYLKPSAPTSLHSFLNFFPTEGETINLMPLIQSIGGDTEFGAYDRIVSPTATAVSATTDRLVNFADGATTTFNMMQFDASSIAPEVRIVVPSPGTGNTFSIQQSNDNFATNTQNFANNTIRYETSGVVVDLANTGFTGLVRFQTKTAAATTWSNVNATNLATGTSTNNATAGGRFYISTSTANQYRVQVETLTAGHVSGTVISNILMSNGTTTSGTLFYLNGILTSPLTPITFLTERPLVTTPATFTAATYIFPVNAASPYIRARYTTSGGALPDGTTLPNIRVTSNIMDPNSSGFHYFCYVETPGPTYTLCSDASFTDGDGNNLYPTEFRTRSNIYGVGSPINWKIPYSFASDGNSSEVASATPASMTRTAKIHLRMVDKGFYNSLNLTPLTATCQSGSPFYSCIDHTFDMTVIDDPAVPTVSFYDNLGQLVNGAVFRPQLKSSSSIEPTFTVTEGSSLIFSMEVTPYSSHTVDQIYFKMYETSCAADGGSCVRSDGTSMLSAITNTSLTGDFKVASPTTITFKIAPNNTDGNSNTLGATSRTYNYKYVVGEACTDTATCTGQIHPTKQNPFGFKIKVINNNNAPTGVDLFQSMPTISHPNINSYVRCGSTQACTMNNNLTVDFDMAKAQNSRDYAIPLKVIDPDLMPNGNPSDNLKVVFPTGVVFTNATIFNEVVDGVPRSFLKVSLPGTNCAAATGGTNETTTIRLQGTDSISTTRPEITLTVTVRGIKPANGQKCLK